MPSGDKNMGKTKGIKSRFNGENAAEMQRRSTAKRRENLKKKAAELPLREFAQQQVKKIIREYLPDTLAVASAKDLMTVLDKLTNLFGVPEDENRTIANKVVVSFEDASGEDESEGEDNV